MPRLIFKCSHIKGGSAAVAHLGNYIGYIATRDGVEMINSSHVDKPATSKQIAMVEQLTQEYPLCKGLLEYKDYLAAPTRGNASGFISRAIEENLDQMAKRENYLQYIAQRPRVERLGSHGLFTGKDEPLVLSQVASTIAQHPGTVWLPILSLQREDAQRLGYDNALRWREMLSEYAPKLADAMKIPLDQFRWYAAFHDEGYHPHVHMVVYSADGKSGFLTKEGISKIKSELVSEIFRQELTEIYQRQTAKRDELNVQSRKRMESLLQEMESGILENQRIGQLMVSLAQQLRSVGGRKQYGYLKASLKALVDEIVDELAVDSRIAQAYDLWYEQREKILSSYKDDLPERLPLSQQKELRQIKNMVIQEALKLNPPIPLEVLQESDELPDAPPPKPIPLAGDLMASDNEQFEDGTSQYRLGWMQLHGAGGKRNEKAAQEWFQRSAKLGNPHAQYQLAKLILADNSSTTEEIEMAIEYLIKSAEASQDNAQYALGKLYRDGIGVEKDMLQAVAWFAQSAEQGNSYAAYAIGKLYLEGKEVPKDMAKALRWLSQSADHGNQFAQYQLGKFYLLGQEIERDEETAVAWFNLSAAQGNEYARWFLDHIHDLKCPSPAQCVAQLLHHMGKVFRYQVQGQDKIQIDVDRKLQQKIREKKIAMGHKPNDYEQKI